VKRVAAVVLLAIVTGCSRLSPGGEPIRPAHHHELRIGDIGDVTTLNPLLSSDLIVEWMSQLTMAYLVRYDRANRPIPELAIAVPSKSNGGISPDGKTITYHLRRRLTWSDGARLNADDVVFSTRLILNAKTNIVSRSGWDRIATIEEPDKYTVVFHLREPYGPYAATFFSTGGANPAIMPAHLLARTGNINTDPYNALPVGAGPFKYVRWQRGDHIELAANPAYWRGRPKLARIVYRIIPNRDTLLAALQTGDIDLWPAAAPAYYERAKAIAGFTVIRQSSYAYSHLDFNLTRANVADRTVRKALELALDRRAQRDKIAHGIGVLQDAYVSPAAPFYDRSLGFTGYDPVKASAMLDAAGWKRGSDGIRAKGGVRLSIDLVSNTGSPDTDRRIELIRQGWQRIGVALVRKNVSSALLFAPYADGGIIYTGKFDVVFFAWYPTGSLSPADAYSCRAIPPQGQNDMHWCDREAQTAIDDFLTTYSPARQRNDSFAVQTRLVSDVPTIVTAIAEDLFVESRGLRGFHPNQVTFFDAMMSVDI
jgi:peptide/nickel transport system substrate-binding protein